jgi:hypothetical protein
MPILVEVVQVKGAVLSVAAPKVVDLDRAVRVDKAVRAKVKTAIKAKKYTMASPLL